MSNDTFQMANKHWNSIQRRMIKGGLVTIVLALVVGAFAFHWTFNRIYAPPNYSVLLRYKGPPLPLPLLGARPAATPGQFAKVDEDGDPLEVGILKEMLGPGRHFRCPLWWERDLVPDVVIKPGEVGVVTSKLGNSLPRGEFLVDGELGETEFKGILRNVLGPGVYRANPYTYEISVVQLETVGGGVQPKFAGWVDIPTGYVGVVTHLADNPITGAKTGIAPEVLPPGLYPVNPREMNIDIVEVGFREKSIKSELLVDANGSLQLDESGEPMVASSEAGINFPSNDGFPISMDFTAVWGIMPDQAPAVIAKFGNVAAVEQKVVAPQVESICRNQGSKIGAVDLLVGESRQEFQSDVSVEFGKVLEDKGLTLLYGLVRHIYIPREVRVPIQQSFIADELTLTREQEQLTARTEASLREAEQKVELESERVKVETDLKVAQALAEGRKTAEETAAKTLQLVAKIDRETADLEAQAQVLLGQAEANAKKMSEEAKSEKFALAVEAFGTGQAFNLWTFASGLPDDIDLKLIYAGDGTFWTDLKGFTDVMLGKQATTKKK